MKRWIERTLGCLLLLLACVPFAYGEKVRYVIDGDTCILENEERVRLLGVDAPEIENVHYQRVGEFFGEESREYLKNLIEGREVRLVDGPEPEDRYGRRLAYIYLDDLLVNRELVRLGYAEAIRTFPYDRKDEFLALEQIARHEKSGMWSRAPQPAGRRPVHWGFLVAGLLFLPAIWRFIEGSRRR